MVAEIMMLLAVRLHIKSQQNNFRCPQHIRQTYCLMPRIAARANPFPIQLRMVALMVNINQIVFFGSIAADGPLGAIKRLPNITISIPPG